MVSRVSSRLRIQVDTSDVRQATRDIRTLNSEAARAQGLARTSGGIGAGGSPSVAATTRSFVGAASALYLGIQAFRAAGAVGSFLASTVDDVTIINNQLAQATMNARELAAARREIEEISLRTRSDFVDNVNAFTRVSIALPGEDLETRLEFLENFNRLAAIGGATNEESSRSLVQLGQAFAGGIVRAEEFNSVVENTPAVIREVARSLGIDVGQLRQRVIDGQLTADDVLGGLSGTETSAYIEEQFSTIAPTIDAALGTLNSQLRDTLGEFLEGTGLGTGIARFALSIANGLNTIGESARENGERLGEFFGGGGNPNEIVLSREDPSAVESPIQKTLNDIEANTKATAENTGGGGADTGRPLPNPGFFVNPVPSSALDPTIDNAVDGFFNRVADSVVEAFTSNTIVNADIDPFGGGPRTNVPDANRSGRAEDFLGFVGSDGIDINGNSRIDRQASAALTAATNILFTLEDAAAQEEAAIELIEPDPFDEDERAARFALNQQLRDNTLGLISSNTATDDFMNANIANTQAALDEAETRKANVATINSTTSALNAFAEGTAQGIVGGLDELTGDDGALTRFGDLLDGGEGGLSKFVEGISNTIPALGLLTAAFQLGQAIFGGQRTVEPDSQRFDGIAGASGGVSGASTQTIRIDGGIFSRDRFETESDLIDADEARAISRATQQANLASREFFDILGEDLPSTFAITGDSLDEALDSLPNSLAGTIYGLSGVALAGEEAAETLARVATAFESSNDALLRAGFRGLDNALITGDAFDRAGGLAGIADTLELRTEAERLRLAADEYRRRLLGASGNDFINEEGRIVDGGPGPTVDVRNNFQLFDTAEELLGLITTLTTQLREQENDATDLVDTARDLFTEGRISETERDRRISLASTSLDPFIDRLQSALDAQDEFTLLFGDTEEEERRSRVGLGSAGFASLADQTQAEGIRNAEDYARRTAEATEKLVLAAERVDRNDLNVAAQSASDLRLARRTNF